MRVLPLTRPRRLAIGVTAAALVLAPLSAAAPAAARTAASTVRIPAPVHRGTLRIAGRAQDGSVLTAAGLRWSPARLPHGMKLLSFEVSYTWQTCRADGTHCRPASDATVTPFAARRYIPGHPTPAGGCGSPRPRPRWSRPSRPRSASRSSAAR